MRYIKLATAVMSIMTATAVQSRSWRVELDGSADFTNIQPAVDAAANGDSILIGAGRFSQTFLYHAPGWSDQVIVGINNKDLTLIGSGQELTFIGPATRDALLWPGPIGIMVDLGCDIRIESLTTENIRNAVYLWSDHLDMINCTLRNHDIGIMTWGVTGTNIVNCIFQQCAKGILGGARGSGLLVSNCEFYGYSEYHIALQGIENIRIESCQFNNAIIAIQFDGSDCYGDVVNCTVNSGEGPHMTSISNSHMVLTNNVLYGGIRQITAISGTISGSGNILHGTSYNMEGCATIYGQMGAFDFHDNHIFRGEARYALLLYDYVQPNIIELDFRDNWWGTTSADTLAAWMYDEHDDPSLNAHTLYEPYHNGPVPNENMSFSEIKAMFRGR